MRRISLFPAALALLALTSNLFPTPAVAEDAATLLAKHRAFVGWQPGDGSVKSLIMDGDTFKTDSPSDKPVNILHEVRSGLAFRETVTSKNGVSDDGFTGHVFWDTNRNGFTHPVIGDGEKYAISQELLFNEAFSSMTNAEVKQSTTVAGTPCTVVEIKIDAAFPLDVCLDESGAVKQAVIDPHGSYETKLNVLSYSTFMNGKKVIGSWSFEGSKYAHRWTKITANEALTDAQLHPPLQTATWQFDGRPFPIEYDHNDLERGIYITATVNGVKGRFLMDTGASEIVLNRSFAGRVHLKPMYNSLAGGIGGITKTEVQKADTIQVGGNVLSNVVVSTFGYDMWNGKENDKELDGLIGYDLFGGAIVNLDLDAQQMTLYDPSTMHIDPKSGVALDVDLSSLQPMIPMKVDGSIPIRAILDSGNLLARVTFSNDMASKYGLRMLVDKSEQGITRSIQFASGVGGSSRMECGTLDSLSVGPIVYQTAPACKSWDFEDNWAIVGFDFIENFNLLFDYPEGRLVLIPRQNQ